MPLYILGISAFFHDSAAALIKDGYPVAAAQEERFSRIRHDAAFPAQAIAYCLDAEGITFDQIAQVVYYEDPKEKFRRVISSFASAGIGGTKAFVRVLPQWLTWKRSVLARIDRELSACNRGRAPRAICTQHHRSHAAAAFYPSPFESAAVLCIDGVGEWQTTSVWHGQGNRLELVESISYPHSLGLLYSAFTYYCGFKVDSGEYKLMGLAPYGQPLYVDTIKQHLINIRPDASFSLNMAYFEFLKGEKMVGKRFEQLFGQPTRLPESPLTQFECDLAASVQKVTEEVVLGIATRALALTGERHLCLAGGVALNCVSNGALSRSGQFAAIWVQPAAGDAGCALGAALDVSVRSVGRPHLGSGKDAMQGSLLGPEFSDAAILDFLTCNNYPFTHYPGAGRYDAAAVELNKGHVVGWFQGRMEFGPRALGARSILGDPRDADMQKKMNLKIKFRESFRPFAPAVLAEDARAYFDLRDESPYMLMVAPVTKSLRVPASPAQSGQTMGLSRISEVRSSLPAITHVDYSARVQTVTEDNNAPFARLLQSFKKISGCPVLVNTSFNVRGEPIVCTPEQAYACFMRTHIDVLVLGPYVLERATQPAFHEDVDWRTQIPLD
jgi:carbamoyltransferase